MIPGVEDDLITKVQRIIWKSFLALLITALFKKNDGIVIAPGLLLICGKILMVQKRGELLQSF